MVAVASLPRRLRTAIRVGPRRQALLVEAAAMLALARARMRLLPMRRVLAPMGRAVSPADLREPMLDAGLGDVAREVGWAVRATASLMPFRALCLEQAIAAQAMLRRRGIGGVLRLGVDRHDAGLRTAHAWIASGEVRVTGYPLDPAMTPVGCFVWSGRE